MSLYQLSKLLYTLNRDEASKEQWRNDPETIVSKFRLSDEERKAVLTPDIGLLYVLGVNGQILMHFAALCSIAWPDYLRLMREGIRQHGPVRAGVYAMTTSIEEPPAGGV